MPSGPSNKFSLRFFAWFWRWHNKRTRQLPKSPRNWKNLIKWPWVRGTASEFGMWPHFCRQLAVKQEKILHNQFHMKYITSGSNGRSLFCEKVFADHAIKHQTLSGVWSHYTVDLCNCILFEYSLLTSDECGGNAWIVQVIQSHDFSIRLRIVIKCLISIFQMEASLYMISGERITFIVHSAEAYVGMN